MLEVKEWAIVPDKNKHEYVIGIDFGHGETSAAYCSISWGISSGELKDAEDIEFGSNKKVIPSAICITADDKAYIGTEAFIPDILKEAEVEVCFKQKPLDINGNKEQLMIRYMSEVYKRIREKNPALFTNSNHLVYIATPSGWDNTAKDLYGKMAKMAGLPIAGITTESRAAFVRGQNRPDSGLPQYIDKGAVVFDMGSSTLDFTYLNNDTVIDFGYDCGASYVEKWIYNDRKKNNEYVSLFENRYPKLISKLLFEARCAKEEVYFHPESRFKKTINFEDIIDDEDLEDGKMKFIFQPGELDESLKASGYIDKISQAMIDFKCNHIHNAPIYVAFLTGGASRMDFIRSLVKECWHLPDNMIYRDQDPSLTISKGVAEVARADIRSGSMGNPKELLNKLVSDCDVYSVFSDSLVDKVADEVTSTIASCVTQFRDIDNDVSINDLEVFINDNIENDMNHVNEWAMECYQSAFEQKTVEIREKLDKMVGNYSQKSVQMKQGNVSINSIDNIDMSVITEQMRELTSTLTDSGIMQDIVAGVAGAAIGGAVAMLLGGPLAWLIGGGVLIANWIFGDNDSEEEKRRKARMKDLDSDARQKVYNHFEANWSDIEKNIYDSVSKAIKGNTNLRNIINSQSKDIISAYTKECISQMRLMVE